MNVIDLILPSDFLVGFCITNGFRMPQMQKFTTSTSFLWAVRLHTGDLQLKAGISISTLELE